LDTRAESNGDRFARRLHLGCSLVRVAEDTESVSVRGRDIMVGGPSSRAYAIQDVTIHDVANPSPHYSRSTLDGVVDG
jgi:hypothetical protein